MNQLTAQKLLKMTKELYDEEALSFSYTRKEVWEKEIIDFVSQIEPSSSVLDLGCGNGRLLELLNSALIIKNLELRNKTKNVKELSDNLKNVGLSYTGIDQSKKLIEINKKKYPSTSKSSKLKAKSLFKVGDWLNLRSKNKFDYIICHAVLHHIPSEKLQLKFLKNIHCALKADGKTLIAVWNRWQNRYRKYFINPEIATRSACWRIARNDNKQFNQFPPKADQPMAETNQQINELDPNDQIVPWKQSRKFRYIHAFRPSELKSLAQRAGFKNIRVFASRHGLKTNLQKALNIYLIGEK